MDPWPPLARAGPQVLKSGGASGPPGPVVPPPLAPCTAGKRVCYLLGATPYPEFREVMTHLTPPRGFACPKEIEKENMRILCWVRKK